MSYYAGVFSRLLRYIVHLMVHVTIVTNFNNRVFDKIRRKMMAVVVDQSKCTGCGDCVAECPCESLSVKDSLCIVDEGTCADCGACIDVCTAGALSL